MNKAVLLLNNFKIIIMKTLFKNQNDLATLILRIGFGFFIVFGHGWGKVQMLIAGQEFVPVLFFGPKLSLIFATLAEFVAGLAVIAGFKTRWASLGIILVMLYAGLVIHFGDPLFHAHSIPPQGFKEFPFLYLTGFLGIFILGAGKYSLDYALAKKEK